jgi:hypothetical protein
MYPAQGWVLGFLIIRKKGAQEGKGSREVTEKRMVDTTRPGERPSSEAVCWWLTPVILATQEAEIR